MLKPVNENKEVEEVKEKKEIRNIQEMKEVKDPVQSGSTALILAQPAFVIQFPERKRNPMPVVETKEVVSSGASAVVNQDFVPEIDHDYFHKAEEVEISSGRINTPLFIIEPDDDDYFSIKPGTKPMLPQKLVEHLLKKKSKNSKLINQNHKKLPR